MSSEVARAEVERLVVEVVQRDATIAALRTELAEMREALKAESRQTLALVRATLPVVQSRNGITPQALAKLDATVAEVLRTGLAQHRADSELAAAFGKLALYRSSQP